MLRLLRVPRDGTPPSQSVFISDEQLSRLIAREGGGDSKRALKVLMKENKQLRDKVRDLGTAAEKLKTESRIAPEGGIVLTAEDAKKWQLVSKHLADKKLTPEQLVEAHGKVGELETKLATRERRDAIATAAKEVGYNGEALADVLELKKLSLEMRDITVQENGKNVKRSMPHVRADGDDKAEWKPLEDFAEEHLKTFLPALTARATSDDEDEPAGGEAEENREERRPARRESGTRFPQQSRSRTPVGPGKTDKEVRDEAASTGMYSGL